MAPRTAAISDDLSSDFSDAARLAVAAGLEGLGVRHVRGVNIRDLPTEEVRSVRAIADAHGLAIAAVTSPFGRDLYLESDDGAAVELLERMFGYAVILGAPMVRIFAPWLRGKDPLPEWSERPDVGAVLPRLTERLAGYARRAERAGITLMLELEGASYVGQVAEARAVLEAVDSPALALCWDVCNGWWSGELPWEEGWPIARELSVVDVQTKDVAASDGDPRRPTYRQVVLGEGDLPYDRIVAGLLADGYDGWFTVERVYHPRRPEVETALQDDVLADIRALHRLLGR
jgi:sugar phosphate isomerase/epimerase